MYCYLKTLSRAAISTTRVCSSSFVRVAQSHVDNEGNFSTRRYLQNEMPLNDTNQYNGYLNQVQSNLIHRYTSPFAFKRDIGVKERICSTKNMLLNVDIDQNSTVQYSKASKKDKSSSGQHDRPNSDILLLVQDHLVNSIPYF